MSQQTSLAADKVQLGDMIEFSRTGYSHWAIYVGLVIVSFLTIYVFFFSPFRDDFVIHRWGEGDGVGNSMGFWQNATTLLGREFDKATVMKTKITDVTKYGGTVRVNNSLDHKHTSVLLMKGFSLTIFVFFFRPLDIHIIVQRAENALGQIGYNVIKKNCEHFVTYCRYDQERSLQVQRFVTYSALGAAAITVMGVAFAYFNRSSETDENDTNVRDQRSSRRTKSKAIMN